MQQLFDPSHCMAVTALRLVKGLARSQSILDMHQIVSPLDAAVRHCRVLMPDDSSVPYAESLQPRACCSAQGVHEVRVKH